MVVPDASDVEHWTSDNRVKVILRGSHGLSGNKEMLSFRLRCVIGPRTLIDLQVNRTSSFTPSNKNHHSIHTLQLLPVIPFTIRNKSLPYHSSLRLHSSSRQN
jgi:hypothetical protein